MTCRRYEDYKGGYDVFFVALLFKVSVDKSLTCAAAVSEKYSSLMFMIKLRVKHSFLLKGNDLSPDICSVICGVQDLKNAFYIFLGLHNACH